MSAGELARRTGKTYESVNKWKTRTAPPKGESVVQVADALDIPPGTFRAAAEGKAPLPQQYRDPSRLKRLRRRDQVWDWFQGAPAQVQEAMMQERVDRKAQAKNLAIITKYFRDRLAGSDGGKKRAG